MANPEHENILQQGVEKWNEWRQANPQIQPDLSNCFIPRGLLLNKEGTVRKELAKKRINYAAIRSKIVKKIINFSHVDFHRSSFEGGWYNDANFEGANFYEADLSRANLSNANLCNCNFRKAYLDRAILCGAEIINANLNRATLVNANLCGTRIENCIVYGVSAWGLQTDENTFQRNLMMEDTNIMGDHIIEEVMRISQHYPLMVDDIEVAQFIHFIKNYSNLGKGLKAMLEKGVLLLGKFREGGREILEKVAETVRRNKLIPIIFDFDGPEGSNIIETVTVLAGISRFVIANLNGTSVPAELERITANFKRPIITYFNSAEEDQVYAMFSDKLALSNVLLFKYSNETELSSKLGKKLAEAEENFQQSQIIQTTAQEEKWKNA
jgi:hypothetical protein